ncbi:hypothetical protein PGTDC60_0668 [Porphyromonas gingivalis TDC60]|uniref:hypothetical protein n=1 Tax=Porphyromonas gingivalis TaxID=837 RepID=UPI00020F00D6|nr:hypothetical protein [Porphyromonas gingivalis]AUR47730.1 lipoprotein [Porphyromonas gingivalis]PDP47706.1 hypothetical protein CLI82_01510 [Porphyromonas gingivalis]BAK24834.1 hypothetical protein PGTDC60_0668 [Porphyromonas gingivalis TDC60]
MKKIFLGCIVAAAFSLVSCNKEEVAFDPAGQEAGISQARSSEVSGPSDDDAALLAQTVALALQSEGVCDRLSDLVSEQRDGDFEVLLDEAINSETGILRSGNVSLKDAFAEAFEQLNSTPTRQNGQRDEKNQFEGFVTSLISSDPLIQIAVVGPHEYDDTQRVDLSSPTIKTVYLPVNFDEKKEVMLRAYDRNGRLSYISSKSDPTEPTIVVGRNERVLALPKSAPAPGNGATPFYRGTSHNYYMRGNYNSISISDLVVSPMTFCDRAKNPTFYDYMSSAKFRDQRAMRKYESGFNGRPEMRYTIIPVNVPSMQIIHRLDNKGWWNGNKRPIDLRLFRWDRKTLGEYYLVHWVEEDPSTTEISIKPLVLGNLFGLNIGDFLSIKIGNRDDEIGGALVSYTDPALEEFRYDVGEDFSFWIKIK